MKILVVSDSHGLESELFQFIEQQKQSVTALIHCGDSELPAKQLLELGVYAVRGNCDDDERFPEEIVHDFRPFRAFITHGHRYNVKMSYVPLSYRADEIGANLVCFGHSHIAVAFQEQETIYINPGSIRQARGRREKTYCIVELREENLIQISFYEFGTNREVKELSQQFQI